LPLEPDHSNAKGGGRSPRPVRRCVEDQSFLVLLLVLLLVVVFAVRFSETRAAARSLVCLSFEAAALGVIFLSAIPWSSSCASGPGRARFFDTRSLSRRTRVDGEPGHPRRVMFVTPECVTLTRPWL
jgi:hypothetical protein